MATEEKMNGNGGSVLKLIKDPLAIIVMLIFQTISFAVFLTQLNGAVTQIIKDNAETKLTAYSKEDARHEREFQDQKYLLLKSENDEQTRRIALLEGQMNALKSGSK